MAQVERITKPSSALFKDVSEDAYITAYNRLVQLRQGFPNYRDDELLLVELAYMYDRIKAPAVPDTSQSASEVYKSTSGMLSTAPATDGQLTKRLKKSKP